MIFFVVSTPTALVKTTYCKYFFIIADICMSYKNNRKTSNILITVSHVVNIYVIFNVFSTNITVLPFNRSPTF